jgi:uncharacterized protein (TIGR03118 family)
MGSHRRLYQHLFLSAGVLAWAAMPHVAAAANTYVQHNLVSDIPSLADNTDAGLVNPWGIAISSKSPFWVNDNRTGLSTVYNSNGLVLPLKVTVLAPPGTTARPTGIVYNGTTTFTVAAGKPASFIFATLQGTISGWNSSVNPTNGVLGVDNSSSGAEYTGLAIGTNGSSSYLYAANFHTGTIDVFDGNFAAATLSGSFADPMVPTGFAPFNIQNLGGKLYVTYAKQDADKVADVAGPGNGFVAVFDLNGTLLQHLIAGGPLNSPWGVAIAPSNFGDFSNAVLVGNFGDGTINAFNATTGASLGTLEDPSGNPILNEGLWGLQFGNGGNGGDTNTLYFAAGIGGSVLAGVQSHGLFGAIQAAPSIPTNGIVNGASFQPGIASNTWISIFGVNLSPVTRAWQQSDFAGGHLPTQLSGVSATVNGAPAYVAYISPKQVNVLVPVEAAQGPVQVQVFNNGLASAAATAQMQMLSPAVFLFTGNKYAAALHADGTPVGPVTLFPGNSTPAKPGEVISIYGTGFGETDPPIANGELPTSISLLAATPLVTIANATADAGFSGLTAAGLYQFNVTIPDGTPDGDNPVAIQVGGFNTQDNALIAVQK